MSAALTRARALLPRRSDWTRARPVKDLTAGLMVGLVALPLALGFGESAGLGAGAGLMTAIVAGIVAAVFGGSRVQVSGPTGAMTVVLVPILAEHGADGVLVVGLIAGALLIALGVLGAGRYVRYVPMPVVEGFTAGIAVIIGLQQVPAALGVDVHAEKVLTLAWRAIGAWLDAPTWTAPSIAAAVAVAVIALARRWPVLPGSLFVVLVATIANSTADLGSATIGAASIPDGLPAPGLPSVPWGSLDALLIATAWQMVHVSSVRPLLRATRGDAATLVATFVATVVLDLVAAVLIGLVVAGFFALRQAARSARVDEVELDETEHIDEEQALLDEHIVAYRIDGPLFFAAAHDFLLELSEVSTMRVVILRLSRVTVLDATGASLLADTVDRLERRGVTVLLSGVQPEHARVLREVGVHGRLAHERHLFDNTPDAIAHARMHAARVGHAPTVEQ